MIEPAMNTLATLTIALLGWMLFVKSPLARLWWIPASPLLHRLGFRLVVMDLSFGLHAIRWRREWVGGVESADN